MKNKADYSKYECPYSHLEKESGHELHGPEGYQDVYGVWCACGFRAPVFYLDPDELGLRLKDETANRPLDLFAVSGLLRFSEREVDFAYLCGVFNTSGIDGMHKEIQRLKELGKEPHDIIEVYRKQ